MSKQGYELAPSAPLPTAPPPPYEASLSQPPYNPEMQATASHPYHYQPASLVHETPHQAASGPYPPQAYYPQPARAPAVTGNRVVVPLMVGPQSLRTTCPNCNATIQSRTTKCTKGMAHVVCLVLFFTCCWICSCIPYCLDSLKEVRHTCPKCKAHLGTFRP